MAIGNLTRKFYKDYTVLDVETTGLSPVSNHIIEFSALKIRDGKIVDRYTTLINPGYLIDGFITSLTGITNEMLEYELSIHEVIDDIINFIGNDIILGHNTNFDLRFIHHNVMQTKGKSFNNDYMDLLYVTRKLFPSWRNHKLETVGCMLNLNNQPSHRAMNDCLATYEAYELCRAFLSE
jgi:DNA polymerase-3 subunit epsilon